MMNLSAPFLLDFFWEGKFEKVLPYVDVLFGNESEAAALAKRLGSSVLPPISVALDNWLTSLPPGRHQGGGPQSLCFAQGQWKEGAACDHHAGCQANRRGPQGQGEGDQPSPLLSRR